LCDHHNKSTSLTGSANVLINNRSALRIGDRGRPMDCGNTSHWRASEGANRVLINGRAAHRSGDETRHCCGLGYLIDGSLNVLIGDQQQSGKDRRTNVAFRVLDELRAPIPNVRSYVTFPDGSVVSAITDKDGRIELRNVPCGVYLLETEVKDLQHFDMYPIKYDGQRK
jgi:uncharacterized Zn-binding protein involved in type VI secretion